MARYTVSEARRRFFQLLDAAERGEEVVLERRGVRFRLVVEPARVQAPCEAPLEILDCALLDGQWSWRMDDEEGLRCDVERDP